VKGTCAAGRACRGKQDLPDHGSGHRRHPLPSIEARRGWGDARARASDVASHSSGTLLTRYHPLTSGILAGSPFTPSLRDNHAPFTDSPSVLTYHVNARYAKREACWTAPQVPLVWPARPDSGEN